MSDNDKGTLGFILVIIGYIVMLLNFWIGIIFMFFFFAFVITDYYENVNKKDNNAGSNDVLFYIKWIIIIGIFIFPLLHFFLEF